MKLIKFTESSKTGKKMLKNTNRMVPFTVTVCVLLCNVHVCEREL